MTAQQRCVYCNGYGDAFWHVTYRGAPDGGVSVHVKCIKQFFEKLDREWWWQPHREVRL